MSLYCHVPKAHTLKMVLVKGQLYRLGLASYFQYSRPAETLPFFVRTTEVSFS